MRILQALQVSFFILLCTACQPNPSTKVSIRWKENKAIALLIAAQAKENPESFDVRLAGESGNMLGRYVQEGDALVFEPIVPFTRGLTYDVLKNSQHYATIEIPVGEVRPASITGIYPSSDTLPENLLKFYFEFSEPMQEDRALNYIFMLDENGDTLKGTFLDLKPELWNTDGTLLTLWLDPGRIKRDLLPNKEMGAPLDQGKQYTLAVSNEWKSKEGAKLSSAISKKFVVTERDENVSPARWVLTSPAKETNNPLVIDLKEPMDYALLREVFSVYSKNELIATTIELNQHEQIITLVPASPWKAGDYVLKVESRLEDLAGNNLNRPFDRDLLKENKLSEQEFHEIKFRVK